MNKDRETAKKYLQQALEGDLMAMNNMGVCYAQGIGVVENHTTAFEWYMKAATLGDTYACYNVAECYYLGDGVKKDDGWAARRCPSPILHRMVLYDWYRRETR